jgi:hypothetical protein
MYRDIATQLRVLSMWDYLEILLVMGLFASFVAEVNF